MSFRRSNRARSQKNLARNPRVLRGEQLESRLLCTAHSLTGELHLLASIGHHSTPTAAPKGTTTNAAPTVARSISGNTANFNGKSINLSVLGADDKGESNLIYNWTATSTTSGATAQFSSSGTNGAKSTTLTFTKAGVYSVSVTIVDGGGLSVTNKVTITVPQIVTGINVFAGDSTSPVVSGTPIKVTGTSQKLSVRATDQFGNAITSLPGLTWSSPSNPSGASAATFASGSGVTTATFGKAGSYVLKVLANDGGASFSFSVNVVQTLTTISVTPNKTSLQSGATQQFAAQGIDQFNQAMTAPPAFTWSASGGSISSSGLYSAPTKADNYGIIAKSGSVYGTAGVSVTAPTPTPTPTPTPNPTPTPTPLPNGFQDADLGNLVQSLFADGSIGRADMIQILTSVGAGGAVSTADFADLKTLLSNASKYNMPSYVQVLGGDVVNGSAANAAFQGTTLGNLKAGSSTAQLNNLIGKWFLGTDHPGTTSSSLGYKQAAGSLFPVAPSHNDEFQGMLGDCYLISSLGTIADRNPTAIQNMFINNGDGTYTVRFYGGNYGAFYSSDGGVSDGFSSNAGVADYVTVDSMLACSSSGSLAYANYGTNVSSTSAALWIPLAEKAYAQWNETGMEGRDGKNAFASIEGGWMATVDAQVLGYNAVDYSITTSTKAKMTAALSSGKAVTIGTNGANSLPYGLYGSHAYAVTAYNATSDTFTLYNPWGFSQPQQLTWTQIQATCSAFVVANPAGSVAIAGANLHSGVKAEGGGDGAAAASSAAASSDSSSGETGSTLTIAAMAGDAPIVGDAVPHGNNGESGEAPAGAATIRIQSSSDRPSAAHGIHRLSASGVDAILASEDVGYYFGGKFA